MMRNTLLRVEKVVNQVFGVAALNGHLHHRNFRARRGSPKL
jgi:hypothetical protein